MSETEPRTLELVAASPLDCCCTALKGHERWLLAAALALQLGVLGSMIASRASVLTEGDVYYVRVVPVDPRDLLRGDYVVLGYAFSWLPPNFAPEAAAQGPRTVYVALVPDGDGKHWIAGAFSWTPPLQGPYLKGETAGTRVRYGIESYYVQEGTGRTYEEAARTGRLSAELAVTPTGTAQVRGLQVGL